MLMFFGLSAFRGSNLVIVHKRTAREEAMHDQIQAAMNWSPEHFQLCEDGKYRNSYGREGVVITLEELMNKRKQAKRK